MDRLKRSTAAAAAVLVLSISACDDEPETPEATAQPAQQGEASETDEGAPALPDQRDEPDDHDDRPDDEATAHDPEIDPLELDGHPYRFHRHTHAREMLTATESTELPIYKSPETSSEIIDHLEVEPGDEIERCGESRQIIYPEFQKAPESFEYRGHDIEEGDRVALFRESHGEGMGTYHLWIDGQYHSDGYSGQPGIGELSRAGELFEEMGFDYQDFMTNDFDFERDDWWIEVEGPRRVGWLLVTDGPIDAQLAEVPDSPGTDFLADECPGD